MIPRKKKRAFAQRADERPDKTNLKTCNIYTFYARTLALVYVGLHSYLVYCQKPYLAKDTPAYKRFLQRMERLIAVIMGTDLLEEYFKNGHLNLVLTVHHIITVFAIRLSTKHIFKHFKTKQENVNEKTVLSREASLLLSGLSGFLATELPTQVFHTSVALGKHGRATMSRAAAILFLILLYPMRIANTIHATQSCGKLRKLRVFNKASTVLLYVLVMLSFYYSTVFTKKMIKQSINPVVGEWNSVSKKRMPQS